jgi:hypothetical protein
MLGVANTVVYVRYAQANYPKSRRWEYLLLGVPFLLGSTTGALAASKDFPSVFFVLFVPASGVAIALMYRFLFVHNMQYVIPKRATPHNSKGK